MRKDDCPNCDGQKWNDSKQCQKCRMTFNPPRRPSRGWHIENSSGYVVRCRNAGTEVLHRALMENKLGRKLSRLEVVHHKNHDRSDNRMANLELMTFAAHNRLHNLDNPSHRDGCGRFCAPTVQQ